MKPRQRVLVYTAIFGDKDEAPLLSGEYNSVDYEVDFLCITDNDKLTSPHYSIEFTKALYLDVTKNARYFKIRGPKNILDYDIAVWHDSSVMLKCERLNELIAHSENYAFSTFKHGHTSIYAEARGCIRQNKDTPLRVSLQMILYALFFRFPNKSLVFETTILVTNTRKYFESKPCKAWWRHVKYLSRRDQLSLPVVLRNSNVNPIGYLTGRGFENPYSIYRGHRYYHYKTNSIIPEANTPITKKISLWIIYRVERIFRERNNR
jgi:hypothetical protein